MNKIINFEIAKHPLNYVIVTLMVLIVGIAISLFLQWQGLTPAVEEK